MNQKTLKHPINSLTDDVSAQVKNLGTQAQASANKLRSTAQEKAEQERARKHAAKQSHRFLLRSEDEAKFWAPKTWAFWRGVIMYFFLFSIVGHWMEIPYCHAMSALFGIVEDTYAVWADPLYTPYWVYGIGTVALTLLMFPLKLKLLKHRKTIWGAALEFFVIAVVLCAAMECIIGLIINQPDAAGEYPYWNNSVLPFNILGQAWLVNDIALGVISLIYTWVVFPFCQKALMLFGERAANETFVGCCILCVIVCIMTYF